MAINVPPEVHSELRVIVRSWRETLKAIKNQGKDHLWPDANTLNFAITIDDIDEKDLDDNPKELKQLLSTLPFVSEQLHKRLRSLIEICPQIKATCLTPWGLSKALDVLLFNIGGTSQLGQLLLPDDELAAQYIGQTFFKEPFTRVALVHLYNLKTDQPEIRLDYINAKILTLTETDLPLITGENTFTSSLHYAHAGNCFLVFENADIEEPTNWLSDQWDIAWQFISVLKYLRNDVIDIDYAGRFYKPTWANSIIRYGVDIMGRPRWQQQANPYYLSDDILPKLKRWVHARQSLAPVLSQASDLARTINLAGNRYIAQHTKNSPVEQLLDLTIALEALFSPNDQQELSFRISQGVALLLGNNADEAKDIFRFVRRMYNERSGFVHGGQDPIEVNRVTSADIARLGDIVRRAIIRFAILLARGEQSRQNIHNELASSVFDNSARMDLRKRSNVDLFLDEKFPIVETA